MSEKAAECGPRWLYKLERGIVALIKGAVVLTGTVMVSSLIIGVFFRYVLQSSLSWTDEVALLCFSWVVFLTAVLLVRDNGHVRVEIIEAMLPSKLHWFLERVIWVAIGVVGGYMVWTGWAFMTLTMGQTSAAVRYPLWLHSLTIPVSGSLIVLYAAGHVFELLPDNEKSGPGV